MSALNGQKGRIVRLHKDNGKAFVNICRFFVTAPLRRLQFCDKLFPEVTPPVRLRKSVAKRITAGGAFNAEEDLSQGSNPFLFLRFFSVSQTRSAQNPHGVPHPVSAPDGDKQG